MPEFQPFFRIRARDVTQIEDVEKRGRRALEYFLQSAYPNQKPFIGYIKDYINSLEGRLKDIKRLTKTGEDDA